MWRTEGHVGSRRTALQAVGRSRHRPMKRGVSRTQYLGIHFLSGADFTPVLNSQPLTV